MRLWFAPLALRLSFDAGLMECVVVNQRGRIRLGWGLLALGCLGACAARTSDLEARAAADLGCNDLRMVELESGKLGGSGRLYGVEGCGRHASYRFNGQRWVQVTGIKALPKAQPAPAPAGTVSGQ
ncbi:MAG TPA: hypothetical protein VLC09_02745 [Polyangiaceae bacterium]|nr:hypothetical protein [Polyangiaceae bacterium]